MHLVLDSSVVLKWFLQEKDSPKALKIYQDILDHNTTSSMPHLILYEVGNILRYKKPYAREKISEAQKVLAAISIDLHTFNLYDWSCIIDLATKYDVSFYDASYVYLAKKLKTKLITADKKLYNKTQKSGFVKLL